MQDRRICPVCGKVCYGGPRDARQAHRHAGYRVRVYRCPDNFRVWHVTNDEKNDRPRQHD